jgi:hypothetical protein
MWVWMGSTDSGEGPMPVSCDLDNEHSGSKETGTFLTR